jgi:hypothetical protein
MERLFYYVIAYSRKPWESYVFALSTRGFETKFSGAKVGFNLNNPPLDTLNSFRTSFVHLLEVAEIFICKVTACSSIGVTIASLFAPSTRGIETNFSGAR